MTARKLISTAAVALSVFATVPVLQAADGAKTVHAKGYITDTWCGVNRDTKPPSEACTRSCVRDQGAKFAFYDTGTGKLYIVQQQDKAEGFAGQTVELDGTFQQTQSPISTMRGPRTIDTVSVVSIKATKE